MMTTLLANKPNLKSEEDVRQYLDEIRIMRAETEYACERVLEEARQEAAAIVAQATSNSTDYRFAVNAIMDEFIEEQPNYR